MRRSSVFIDDEPLSDDITHDQVTGKSWNTRMHLTRTMVAELLPLLQQFVGSGEIGSPTPSGEWNMNFRLEEAAKVCREAQQSRGNMGVEIQRLRAEIDRLRAPKAAPP